ncbi:MAG: sensor histidine kinase [Planctomycetia bacterium]|nr:sensor histidine kinase [Planctomycetia bacterium]
MPGKKGDLQFDVHPSVVFQLGAELTSDDLQALIELVKNCYDADASYASVTVNTLGECKEALSESFFPDAKGYVVISDDGAGMDVDTIRQGWLVVSNSMKRRLKASGSFRRGSRVPLGDKGLGRLGAQRIAQNVEVISSTRDSNDEYHIGFSWSEFSKHELLSEVPILGPQKQQRQKGRSNHGTTVLLSGLVDPSRWHGPTAKVDLEDRFAELISPFESIDRFDLAVTVDGVKIDPARVARKIRNEADATFSLGFDGQQVRLAGKVKMCELEPSGDRRRVFNALCEPDNGAGLLAHLQESAKGGAFRVQGTGGGAWFLRFEQTVEFAGLDKLILLPGSKPASPGPFRAEVDSFDLGRQRQPSVFSDAKEFKKLIKSLASVRVYRDGFGIRVPSDFLKLAKAWTSGGSWYGLKPANTIGFIAITARENPDLLEATDREGFIRTPAYENFERVLDRFVHFTHEALEFGRRQTIVFCDQHVQEQAGVPADMRPEELAQRIGEQLGRVTKAHSRLGDLAAQVASCGEEITKASEVAQKAAFTSRAESREVDSAIRRAKKLVDQAESAMGEVSRVLDEAPEIQRSHAVLQAQVERFHDRLSQAYETMGLGLTAEALVHEITFIADGLGERVAEVRRYLKSRNTGDERIQSFVRHVDAAVNALRKQLAHLDPALRFVREKREVIALVAFLQEMREYHESRWREGELSLVVDQLSRNVFDVRTNRGKLTQVFDNLILNSQYWLREDIRRGRIKKGEVLIETRAPTAWVSDNGLGIDPSVEGTLFDPFVTTRKGGRGLGLFVVQEFLRSEGCTIRLYPERNKAGRYYAFELDLSELMHGQSNE